jgi:hypothetical protein
MDHTKGFGRIRMIKRSIFVEIGLARRKQPIFEVNNQLVGLIRNILNVKLVKKS